MKGRGRAILAQLGYFAGLLILAFAVSELVYLTNLPWWAQAVLIFLGTKTAVDVIASILRRERKFLYFEDYLRETLMFMAVAGIGVLGIAAVESYMGGVIWVPLLAAALMLVWR